MPKRPCIGVNGKRCGKPTTRTRCPQCQREWDRGRNQAKASTYTTEWRRNSRTIRTQWVATHGWWCPGWQHHQPHPSRDLVVDHDHGVMCRQANAIKANTIDRGIKPA